MSVPIRSVQQSCCTNERNRCSKVTPQAIASSDSPEPPFSRAPPSMGQLTLFEPAFCSSRPLVRYEAGQPWVGLVSVAKGQNATAVDSIIRWSFTKTIDDSEELLRLPFVPAHLHEYGLFSLSHYCLNIFRGLLPQKGNASGFYPNFEPRQLRPRCACARVGVSAPCPGTLTGQASGVSASGDINLAGVCLWYRVLDSENVPNGVLSAIQERGK